MISVENTLISVQIKFIITEVYKIKEMYFSDNSEDDRDYYSIICDYEVQIESQWLTKEGKLKLYKEMYQKCVDFLYDSARRHLLEVNEDEEEQVEYLEFDEDIDISEDIPF